MDQTLPDTCSVNPDQSPQHMSIWDHESGELRKEIQEAVNKGGDELLEALKLKSEEGFDQTPRKSYKFVFKLLKLNLKRKRPTLLEYAAMDYVLGQLKGRLNLDETNTQQLTLLHLAVKHHRPECVQLLLAHGVDPESESPEDVGKPWRYLLRHRDPPGTMYATPTFRNRELLAIFDLHRLESLSPTDYIACTWASLVGYSGTASLCTKTFSRSSSLSLCTETITVKANLLDIGHFAPFGEPHTYSMVWIHVPQNSFPIISSISRYIGRSVADRIDHGNGILTNDVVRYFLDSFAPPAVTARERWLNYRDPTYTSGLINNVAVSNIIVFPCLALHSTTEWERRKREHERIRHSLFLGDPTIDPKSTGIYFERTLDEAYYPGLDSELLGIRNADQVIQKQIQRENERAELPILMVPQLWLWRVDNVLVSTFSMTPPSTLFGHFAEDEPPRFYPELCTGTAIDLQISHILKAYIDSFGEAYHDSTRDLSFPPTLDIFETAVVALLSDVRKYITGRKSQDIEIENERKFIEFIADIQNELDMIQTIIEQQEEVLNNFQYDKSREVKDRQGHRGQIIKDLELQQRELTEKRDEASKLKEIEGRLEKLREEEREDKELVQVLDQAKNRLDKYTKRIEKINRDAGRVAKTIDDMLNLSRTDASVKLAQSSIQLAESSIKEAHYSVLIGLIAGAFAVVTIIFTPLSFVTSLLTLPSDQKPSTVAGGLVGAEIATLVFTGLVVGFTYVAFRQREPEKKLNKIDRDLVRGKEQRREGQDQQKRGFGRPPNGGIQHSEGQATTEEDGQKPVTKSREKTSPKILGDENV